MTKGTWHHKIEVWRRLPLSHPEALRPRCPEDLVPRQIIIHCDGAPRAGGAESTRTRSHKLSLAHRRGETTAFLPWASVGKKFSSHCFIPARLHCTGWELERMRSRPRTKFSFRSRARTETWAYGRSMFQEQIPGSQWDTFTGGSHTRPQSWEPWPARTQDIWGFSLPCCVVPHTPHSWLMAWPAQGHALNLFPGRSLYSF